MQPQIPATTGRLSTPSAAADSARGDKFLGECAANTGVSLNVRGWCSFPGLKSPGSLRNPRFTTVYWVCDRLLYRGETVNGAD